MTFIKRSALIGYSSRQMFELVNAIEDYPRFLPGCRESDIITRDEKQIEASLEIAWSGLHKRFTTRNRLYPYDRIDIELVNGPFHHLEGNWMFSSIGPHACKIDLELEFELAGNFFDKLFQPVFHKMANELVDVFCKRAQITPLLTASTHIHPDPQRTRKLLLHQREISKLIGSVERKGYTLVPLKLYWKNNRVKLEIGLAKGKKLYDKRAAEKERDWKRSKERGARDL